MLMKRPFSKKFFVFRFVLAVLVLAYGWLTRSPDYFLARWIGVGLFSIPLLVQFLPWRLAQVYGLWFAFFLVLQSVISPWVRHSRPWTLYSNYRSEMTFEPGSKYVGIEGKHVMSTDEKGFRVTADFDYDNKAPDEYRIFAIGGSTTEQIYLDDRKTWTHYLQEALQEATGKQVVVINTGVAGLRMEHHYVLAEQLLAYEPDMFIVMAGINDWNRDVTLYYQRSEAMIPWAGEFLYHRMFDNTLIADLLVAVRNQFSGKLDKQSGQVEQLHFEPVEEWGPGRHRRSKHKSYRPEEVSGNYRNYMNALLELCQEQEVALVFATQATSYSPEATDAMQRTWWHTPPGQSYTLNVEELKHIAHLYNSWSAQKVREAGYPVCDLATMLPPTFEVFYDDCHFNESGARLVAEGLTPVVEAAMRADEVKKGSN